MAMAGEAALSLRDGARRVNRAPAIVASLWLTSVAIALPLVLTVRTTIADHLGGSLEAGAAADGVNYDWMQEFSEQATGLGVTFGPTVIGFAAVLDNLSAFMDATSRPAAVAGAAAVALFITNFSLFAVVVALYALVAPGAGTGRSLAIGIALGQLYVIARLCVKLVFWASETSLFQHRLAHAGYVARPRPMWPDSPAADAIHE